MSSRSRGLTQRHRTLLLLIDGQRALDQVLHLAHQAGVPRAYIDELVALGLVVVPAAALSPAAPVAAAPPTEPVPAAPAAARGSDVELRDSFVVRDAEPDANRDMNRDPTRDAKPGRMPGAIESANPSLAADPLHEPDLDDTDPWDDDDEALGRVLTPSELAALDSSDQSLAEARNILLQALRQEAPVAGAVTMLRVRRARSRDALVALLPEVEQKIGNQRHLSDAARILRRVHELLAI